jgi:hypothetical protein
MSGNCPHFEGIVLAARATHLWWMQEIAKAEARGVDGDALGWTQGAGSYRVLIGVLEHGVAELESERARLLSKHTPDEIETSQAREALAAYVASEIAHASWRAQRAKERADGAVADEVNALEARQGCAQPHKARQQ